VDFPYLAVLWTPDIPAQHNAAARILASISEQAWHPTLHKHGLAVFTQEPTTPYLKALRLGDEHGVILGALFSRSSGRLQSTQTLGLDAQLIPLDRQATRHLTTNYWGGYVALFSEPLSGRTCVMRECSGTLSCYYTTVVGVTIVSSDARNLVRLSAITRDSYRNCDSVDINWSYLAGFLAYSQLQIRETAIKNVYELLAGETLIRRDSQISIEVTWNPVEFSAATSPDNLDTNCAELRETTQSCINAWAHLHQCIIHSLSGGFDSSLLLALLCKSPNRPHVVCLTRYASGPAEDERYFARIVAKQANTELIEWPWNMASDALIDPSTIQPLDAKPSISSLMTPSETTFFTMLRTTRRFDAVWTGEGGDHLFLALPTTLCLSDFKKARGFRKGFGSVIYNTARLTGRSIPNLFLRTLFPSASAPQNAITLRSLRHTLLETTPEVLMALEAYIQHPWATMSRNVPPGKRQQILLLSEVLNRLRPIPGTQESMELQPLLSQPIIELCLRIPTYQLLCNGHVRGLARRAFASDLPHEILGREVKGQTTHYALGLLRQSLPRVVTSLLHGELVDNGLVNSKKLKTLLSEPESITASQIFPLFACVAAQAWISAWSRTPLTHHDVARSANASTNLI
jgi:asparagine synthase (glutamine-hydrolysing)